jgi:hypothetical protein
MRSYSLLFTGLFVLCMLSCSYQQKEKDTDKELYASCKPYTRWWWFASQIDTTDIKYQIDFLSAYGFGGVEIAFVYPVHGDTHASRYPWISEELSRVITWTKEYAGQKALGCDFTFGTLWPFGDSYVVPEYGSLQYGDSISPAKMRLTWEHPVKGRVINHLDSNALKTYACLLKPMFANAMQGSLSALFCDSWEVETRRIWTQDFEKLFIKRYGYDIRDFMDHIYQSGFEDYYYDYMKLISELVVEQFYKPFTRISHEMGGFSRVQCGGAPADLISAFAAVDIPETEAILYEPSFARIPVSAASLCAKNIVSSETFTCIYGWKGWPGPGPYQGKEKIMDLKILADALFANGVNQIFWHGMPFNGMHDKNKFYASVHVGRDASFVEELKSFNCYMTEISEIMRKGKNYSDIAVYFPWEDALMQVEYPDSLKFPWVWGAYEMRYIRVPEHLKGYQPLWINYDFLKKAYVRNNKLYCGNQVFEMLYVDVAYMDIKSLTRIMELAESGLPVCLKRKPLQAGRNKNTNFNELLEKLMAFEQVQENEMLLLKKAPLLSGEDLPDFWIREDKDTYWIFIAHPATRLVKYPMPYAFSDSLSNIEKNICLSISSEKRDMILEFRDGRSFMLQVNKNADYKLTELGWGE